LAFHASPIAGWVTFLQADGFSANTPYPAPPSTHADVGSPVPTNPVHKAGDHAMAKNLVKSATIATTENATSTELKSVQAPDTNPTFTQDKTLVPGGYKAGYLVEMRINYVYPSHP
jgi:hypothetical protein